MGFVRLSAEFVLSSFGGLNMYVLMCIIDWFENLLPLIEIGMDG
ncbi:MAG: hypothetical protein WBE26_14225 [Phycisphaerae bacterium]